MVYIRNVDISDTDVFHKHCSSLHILQLKNKLCLFILFGFGLFVYSETRLHTEYCNSDLKGWDHTNSIV